MTQGTVLVTGAFGLVGSAVVRRLAGQGRAVVATDLELPATRRAARGVAGLPGVAVRWADLTDAAAVQALLAEVRPAAIVHLAAVIPPLCYARRDVARAVNVGGTTTLVRAAASLYEPPRLVLASSVAVYGPRNPHRSSGLLTESTALAPCDVYGAHKVEAERIVTSSGLEWVVLRLGGVLGPERPASAGADMLYFEGLLPIDGRIQTVDVRDVAAAFDAATTTEATGEVFLVGGDESHRVSQAELSAAFGAAMGLGGALASGRPGDPDDERAWFTTDHMDTTRAQQVLEFQHHPLPVLLDDARRAMGWRRGLLRALEPLLDAYLRARAPYRGWPGVYADPWAAVERRWGDPAPDVVRGSDAPAH